MQTNNNTHNVISDNALPDFRRSGVTETKNVVNTPAHNLENKPITDFVITNVAVKKEVVLEPNVFKQQLQSGELKKISSKIIVTGNVNFRSDKLLTKLPDNLEVQGTLSITNCENLTKFPKNLIAESLSVSNCHQVINLAESMSIKQEIRVTDCNQLTNLSSEDIRLSLDNSLIIQSCKKLESLPNFSKIGKDLKLYDCPLLVKLPETANISGNIAITHCPKIITMPISWSSDLVANKQSSDPKVQLTDTGISLEQIKQYNQNYTNGVKIMLGVDGEYQQTFNNLDEAFFYWSHFANDAKDIPTIVVSSEQEQDLCELFFMLAKLTEGYYNNSKLANNLLEIPHLLHKATECCKISAFKRLHKDVYFSSGRSKHITDYQSLLSIFVDMLKE